MVATGVAWDESEGLTGLMPEAEEPAAYEPKDWLVVNGTRKKRKMMNRLSMTHRLFLGFNFEKYHRSYKGSLEQLG